MGKTGIYLSTVMIGLGLFGIVTLFYIFFAQTLVSMFDITPGSSTYFWAKNTTVIILSLSVFPFVMKKQISELDCQRYLQPIGTVLVVVVLGVKGFMT